MLKIHDTLDAIFITHTLRVFHNIWSTILGLNRVWICEIQFSTDFVELISCGIWSSWSRWIYSKSDSLFFYFFQCWFLSFVHSIFYCVNFALKIPILFCVNFIHFTIFLLRESKKSSILIAGISLWLIRKNDSNFV